MPIEELHAFMFEPKELSDAFSHAPCGNMHDVHNLWRIVFGCESTTFTPALSNSPSEWTATKTQRGKVTLNFYSIFSIRFNLSSTILLLNFN